MQLFCDEERVKMRDANPEAKFGELNTLFAAKWKLTPEADKERFQKARQVWQFECQKAETCSP